MGGYGGERGGGGGGGCGGCDLPRWPVPPAKGGITDRMAGGKGVCEDGVLRRIRMLGMRANADRLRPDTFWLTAHRLSVLTARSLGRASHTGGWGRSGPRIRAVWKSGCSVHRV